MSMDTAEPPVTVSGSSGLLATVPAILGFHPAESLVLMCLNGPRCRVGPVVRVDLPPSGNAAAVARDLAGHARRHADLAALICYTDRPGRPELLDATLGELHIAQVPLLEVMCVRNGTARSARTRQQEAGDRGFPVPDGRHRDVLALAAATAFGGRQVLPDRGSLRRSVAGPQGERLAAAVDALTAAAAGLARSVDGLTGPGIEFLLHERGELTMNRSLRQIKDSGTVDADTAAMLILLCGDVGVRDAIIARAVTADDVAWLPLLIATVTRAPDQDAAQICAVLAVVAYRYGDGALAQVAVDRCLAIEPGHRLAHLMLSVMAAGLPPSELTNLASSGPRLRSAG